MNDIYWLDSFVKITKLSRGYSRGNSMQNSMLIENSAPLPVSTHVLTHARTHTAHMAKRSSMSTTRNKDPILCEDKITI